MRPLLVALLACALVVPAAAVAAPFDDVFADYQTDGRIDPCEHSPEALQQAKDDIPNDIDQYAPEFPGALDGAIAARAGGCEDGQPAGGEEGAAPPPPAPEAPGGTTPNPAGQTPAPPGTAQPAGPAADGAIAAAAAREQSPAGNVPPALLALGVLLALLALATLLWGLFRFFAWEPRWLLGARHAVGEAGWRTGGAWADFTDWLRSRRSPA